MNNANGTFKRYDDEPWSSTYLDCIKVGNVGVKYDAPAWAFRALAFARDNDRDLDREDVIVRRRNTGMTTILKKNIFEVCYGKA